MKLDDKLMYIWKHLWKAGNMNSKTIKTIEFFPDYCSSGIWVTYENSDYHVNVESEDLPIELPKYLINKIKAMSLVYNIFSDDDGSSYNFEKYGMTLTGNCFAFMVRVIETDFLKEFPEYKDKLLVKHHTF